MFPKLSEIAAWLHIFRVVGRYQSQLFPAVAVLKMFNAIIEIEGKSYHFDFGSPVHIYKRRCGVGLRLLIRPFRFSLLQNNDRLNKYCTKKYCGVHPIKYRISYGTGGGHVNVYRNDSCEVFFQITFTMKNR